MTYNPKIHHRQSIRLRGYDYTQAGLYFITICTHERAPLFGNIVESQMILNDGGLEAEKCWFAIPEHFHSVALHEFIIMPNHVHGIIAIVANNNVAEANVGVKNLLLLQHGTSRTIGSIVRGFKIGVTKWFRANTAVHIVWQRNYYEHIIRNEADYLKIADYIQTNPQRWLKDTYHV